MPYFLEATIPHTNGYTDLSKFPKTFKEPDSWISRTYDKKDRLIKYENSWGAWIDYFYHGACLVKEIHSCGYVKIHSKSITNLF